MATPGLQKLNIPQNRANSSTSRTSANSSDLKHVAARNMSNASRATGATSYGIFAQRSKVGSGGIFNIKTFYGDSIAAQRRYLNSNRQVIDNNFYGNQKCSGSDNGMNKFMAGMMAANMLAQLGAQTADVVKSMKGTGSTKPTNNTEETNSRDKTSGTNTSSTKSLGEMKSADNSTALEAALSKAKNDQDAIPDKINTANSELAQLKGQTDGLKGKYEEAQTTLDKHNKEVSETSAKVNELTNSVGAAEMSYNSAVQHKDYLESQLSKATDIVAKNSLEAQIAKAKNNVKNEKEKLDKLKDDLEKTQDKLNNLNSQTNDLKQAVGDAKDAYDKNVKDIDTKQKEISQLEQDKAELDKEIPKQKDRLI